jgi:MFS family permease
MDGAAGYAGWRWLYIIEGAVTIVFGFACFWLLPNKPEHAYFLNAQDKENMMIRAEQSLIYHGKEQFEWRQVRSAFKEFKLYIRCSDVFSLLRIVRSANLVLISVYTGLAHFFPSLLRRWVTVTLKLNT